LAAQAAAIALEFDNRTLLQRVGPHLEEAVLVAMEPRLRQALRAFRLLHASLVRKRGAAKALLKELLDDYAVNRGIGHQDFVVSTLAHQLVALQRDGEARTIVTNYLEEGRPERGLLLPSLQRIATSLAAASA
jgi:hypothetical protein